MLLLLLGANRQPCRRGQDGFQALSYAGDPGGAGASRAVLRRQPALSKQLIEHSNELLITHEGIRLAAQPRGQGPQRRRRRQPGCGRLPHRRGRQRRWPRRSRLWRQQRQQGLPA